MPKPDQRLEARLSRVQPPAQQLGGIFLRSLERMGDFQLELMRSYMRFTLRQWREALRVRSAADLRGFVEQQAQATQDLGQQVAADARELLDPGGPTARDSTP